jgi:hypothetical protein
VCGATASYRTFGWRAGPRHSCVGAGGQFNIVAGTGGRGEFYLIELKGKLTCLRFVFKKKTEIFIQIY